MTKVAGLQHSSRKATAHDAVYDGVDEGAQLVRTLIEARTRAGLSQAQLAQRMKTSQSYVARIESGKVRPSTDALHRVARATGTRLRIMFEQL
jgi:ribosome-binding protein aMBF1 (putative translation factor)